MEKAMQGTVATMALRWFVRTLLYATFIELLLASLYALGNFQQFSDATQNALVGGLRNVSSFVTGGVGVALCAAVILAIVLRRGRIAWLIPGILGMGIVSVSFLVGSTAIATLSNAL